MGSSREKTITMSSTPAQNSTKTVRSSPTAVLGVTATGKDLKEARKKAYEATEWISFENKYMRHDIGKAIEEA